LPRATHRAGARLEPHTRRRQGRARGARHDGRRRHGGPARVAGSRRARAARGNGVHRGIVDLSRETDACIVVAGVFSTSRRYILGRTWDRTQLPHPFSTLTARFRTPIDPRDFADVASLRERVSTELLALEQTFDPDEARHAGRLSPRATARLREDARGDRTA
jgi:hypothetical protein